MKSTLHALIGVGCAVAMLGCGNAPSESDDAVAAQASALGGAWRNFSVDFSGCREFVGQAPVSLELARAQVPSAYHITGEEMGQAKISVRAVRCDGIAVDGGSATPGIYSQIGVDIASPDGTADINTVLLFSYTTNHAALATRLSAAGVDVRYAPNLTFSYTPSASGGDINANYPLPSEPVYTLSGTVGATGGPVPFTANWWARKNNREIRMQTFFPNISLGFGGSVTLQTAPNGQLGQLLGSGTTNFPLLTLTGDIPTAHMDTTVSRL